MPRLIHLRAFDKRLSFSLLAHSLKLRKMVHNTVKGRLNPFLGSRKGKYESRLVRVDCARLESSHLHAVLSHSKSLFDMRGR